MSRRGPVRLALEQAIYNRTHADTWNGVRWVGERKEQTMDETILYEEGEWTPNEAQLRERDRRAVEEANARLKKAAVAERAQREREEIERLRQGGSTERMRRARERLRLLNVAEQGIWQPTGNLASEMGSQIHARANDAAKAAVAAAMAEVRREAEEELRLAIGERDERVRKARR